MAFSITFGFATNKIIPDDSDHLHTQQSTQDYLELTQSSHALPPIECEKARRRGYSGSTHEEIVISRAFAEAVFPADRMIIKEFKERYTAIDKQHESKQTLALLSRDLHRKSVRGSSRLLL